MSDLWEGLWEENDGKQQAHGAEGDAGARPWPAERWRGTLPAHRCQRREIVPPGALEPAREFVQDSLPVARGRRTGAIRESISRRHATRRISLARACLRVCVSTGGGPEKAQLARLPSRSDVPWTTLRLAWRLWPLSSTGETNWRSWSDSRSGSFRLTSHAILRLNGL